MTEPPAKPTPKALLPKDWAAKGFRISVGFAVAFGIIFILAFAGHVIGAVIGNVLSYAGERILPMAFREFLLWFADELLPQIAPAVKWMQTFGSSWSGLLAFAGFVVTVFFGIIPALSSRRKSSTKKGI